MRKLVLLFTLSVLIASCAPQAKFLEYTEESFEPTSEVEIFHTRPPDEDYVEMGVISIQIKKQNENEVIVIVREKAKEIGADAIIILGERNQGVVAMPIGNMAYGVPIRDFQALAIKYKN